MPFWFALLIFAVSTFVGELLRPKPKFNQPKKAGLNEFQLPTSSETRPVAVGWGTFKQAGPNVLYFGDYEAMAITEKVKTSFFMSKRITTGWRYHVGLAYSLCWGVIDAIEEIWVGDKSVWTGSVASGAISIDKQELFGGDKEEGGYKATLNVSAGTGTQAASSYLKARNGGRHPAYRNIAYVEQLGPSGAASSGYIGTTKYLKPIAFQIRRCPNNLALQNGGHNIAGDANPAEMLYELLTNPVWGMGLGDADVNKASFTAGGNALASEALGLSMLWDNTTTIEQILKEICRHIDALVYVDLHTGKYTLKLARNDYNVSDLVAFDESNIRELVSYTRGALDETTNEVRVTYLDRAAGFVQRPAQAHDPANFYLQGFAVPTEIDYPSISTAGGAARLAQRDLRTLSLPLAKHTIRVNRKGNTLYEGAVYKWSWRDDGILNMVMRVLSIRYGRIDDGTIEIAGVQDIFSLGAAVYAANPASGHVDPVGNAAAVAVQATIECPYYFYQAEHPRVLAMAGRPAGGAHAYDLFVSKDGGASFAGFDEAVDFTPCGVLQQAYAATTADIDAGSTLKVVETAQMSRLMAATAAEVAAGVNLIYFPDADEWMAFESFTVDEQGVYMFTNVWRGLLDTVPQSHEQGARVFFFSSAFSAADEVFGAAAALQFKHRTRTINGELSLSQAPAYALQMAGRALKPLPASNVTCVDTSSTASGIGMKDDLLNDWTLTESHTAGLSFDGGQLSEFANDTSRAYRNSGISAEQIVYRLDGATNVDLYGFHWGGNGFKAFAVETSPDNLTWTTRATTDTFLGQSGSSWAQWKQSLTGLTGVNYVRITWNTTTTQLWTPQLGRAVVSDSTSNVNGQVRVSWRRRNRRTQTSVIRQTAADIEPEAGTSYTLRFYGVGNVLRRTVTGVPGAQYDYTAADEMADSGGALNTSLRVEIETVVGGVSSWQRAVKQIRG